MNIKRLLVLSGTVLSSLTLVWMCMFFLSVPPESARAAGDTYTVCPTGPCDYNVIQDAVDAAENGDVIKVAAGTYDDINNYSGLAQVVYINKSVTIRGGYTTAFTEPPDPVANPTTLDAGGQGRVIYIEGNNINPTIEGLRITGGDAASMLSGGGVQIYGAAATFRGNQIFNNTAYDGGGLRLDNSAATLEDNKIFSNTANNGGGGLFLSFSPATLSGNNISDNAASGGGGGAFIDFSAATLNDNTIAFNTGGDGTGGLIIAESDNVTLYGNTIISNTGGGLSCGGGNNILISGNTISYNTAEWGGGMSNEDNVTYIGNTISYNSATRGGGGLFGDSDVTLIGNSFISNTAEMGGGLLIPDATGVQIIGNTFSGNYASSQGGGLDLWNGNPILINNLIVDNHADGTGSALNLRDTSSRLSHNTIARNSGDGSGINISIYLGSSTITLTNNIIVSHTMGLYAIDGASVSLESTLWGEGIWANGTNWAGGGTIIQTNEHSGDPDFVDYLVGDYHIGENSDAKDNGIDAGVTTDIDFHPRPYQLPDIGADEYWPPGTLKFIYLPLVIR